ncbi:hypothetical protein KBX18_06100 [Corynebacterium sp. CCUG 69979]|uniref:hypothetical protein n=1 Tax=Corynebacterium sp. CCUG 69979 TaxID=2823890 RepID=UPI00210BF602|nr:hypothetical protein [Corynebacterium sp. CCUG 69979]MCQ4625132.1 hypothetical protein [Corynebacterium sp. CCUG 69979]
MFAAGLKDRLPGEYPEVVAGIVDKLGPELAEGEGYFNHSFHLWPVSRYIEDYGALAPVRFGDFVAYAPTRSCSMEKAE